MISHYELFEMFITEFDTRQSDIYERARDFEDFMRMAFSYPNVKDRAEKETRR